METMTALDASFLHVEDAVSHMHIGSVGVFEGPAPAQADVLAAIAGKLPLVPRYRQRVRSLPLTLGRPSWIDDPHFRLDYHVRRTALPAPGGDQELRNLVGRVMAQKLDRSKPLWEMWIVEGVGEGRWALISKVHHVMVDGVSATDLLSVLLDADRDAPPGEEKPWRPSPAPSTPAAAASALAAQLTEPLKGVRDLAGAVRHPRALAARATTVANGVASFVSVVRRAGDSSLNGPIGPHRRWAWASGRLTDIKAIRDEHGGSVNDVVLAVIARGFRDLLIARGESVEGRAVQTMVPVSVRTPGERGAYNNRVSAMFAALPVGVADPVERLAAVRTQMDSLKRSGQAVAGSTLTSLGGFAPPMLFALAARVGSRTPQWAVNTVTTNVPGPQHPMYLAGRRLLNAYPFVPLVGHIRVGVAIFSYDGNLNFGVTGDYDTAPDIETLCAGIEAGIRELLPPVAPAPRRKAASTPKEVTT
jgi:diacylglycerol O-acyltransferase / wax synthase